MKIKLGKQVLDDLRNTFPQFMHQRQS